MKDLHTHLLFGIDDGCKDIEESVQLIKKMVATGVTEMILTPHFIENSKYTCNNEDKKMLLATLRERLIKENIEVKLYLGNEAFYSHHLEEQIESGQLMTLNGSKYLLFEFPMHNNYHSAGEIISKLISNGYTPILAHPERYRKFQEHPEIAEEYLRMGLLLQGNYTSLFGKYGSRSKRTLKFLIRKGWVSFLGSDVHHDFKYNEKKLRSKLERLTADDDYIEDLLGRNFDKVVKNIEIGLIR